MNKQLIQNYSEIAPIKQKNNHPKSAIFSYILIFISSFTWVSGFIYPNQHNIKPWETNALKGYMLLIICYFICKHNGHNFEFSSKKDFKLMMLRNGIFVIHDFVTAWIQFRLPLPIVHNINNLISVIVMIIQHKVQNKQLTRSQKIATFLVLIGVIFISNYRLLQPLIRPDYTFQTQFQNYGSNSKLQTVLLSFVFLGFVILAASAMYISTYINMNIYQVNFHYSLMLILTNSIIYCFSDSNSSAQILLYALPFSSLVFAVGQLAFTGSLLYATNVGITLLLGSFTIVVSYVWSLFRYHQSLSIFSVLGSTLIISGISKILLNPQK